jgi:hypothetical protein
MVSKETLLDILPYRDQVVLKEDRQNTDDIRAEILAAHKKYAPDYDLIYHYFNTGNIIDTSRQIFDFLKQNVPYKKENGKYQTVKSPAAILMAGDGNEGPQLDRVDCKNYSLFIAGLLDAIRRHDGGQWDWCYRFASYNEVDPEPGHVFVVVKMDGRELWIDPVFTYFNSGDMHEWELDQKPGIGGLYEISGPAVNVPPVQSVTVDAKTAAKNFLVDVELNLLALPQLLLNYPGVTNGPVKQVLIASGVNWDALQTILRYVRQQGY